MVLVKTPPSTLLILTHFTPPASEIDLIKKAHPHLNIVYFNVPWSGDLPEDFPHDVWENVTVLLTSTYLPTKEQAPRLRYVQLTSAGANQILDKPLFLETKLPFCTANGVHGPQISEWVIASFLAHQHHFFDYYEQQKQARWHRILEQPDSYGQTVGILGYGSIGRQIARVATAMGIKVHAYTLHPRNTPDSRKDHSYSPPGIGDPDGVYPSRWFSGDSKEDIHTFLGSGLDLLVVATPLTEQTKGLLGKEEFEVLSKKKTFVSNIARGPIIKSDDLVEALDKGLIRGAAIDVTDPEPLPDGHPLWGTKNLFITPHVSGASDAYFDRVLEILRLNLDRLKDGKELVNQFNRKVGY